MCTKVIDKWDTTSCIGNQPPFTPPHLARDAHSPTHLCSLFFFSDSFTSLTHPRTHAPTHPYAGTVFKEVQPTLIETLETYCDLFPELNKLCHAHEGGSTPFSLFSLLRSCSTVLFFYFRLFFSYCHESLLLVLCVYPQLRVARALRRDPSSA